MKHKLAENPVPDGQEQDEVLALKRLVAAKGDKPLPLPPDSYWGNLLIRANQRIDEATSGRALSISWAARVAIPGVIAILSFLFGLQYYVPDEPGTDATFTALVQSLPEETIDSLLAHVPGGRENYSQNRYPADPFVLSDDQIADYLSLMGATNTLLEAMSDNQLEELLAHLASEKKL